MTVEISRLEKDYQAVATAADRATGHPDGRTSLAELDGYLEANAVLLTDRQSWFWERMRYTISLLEADDRLSPARRAELLRIAAEVGREAHQNSDIERLLAEKGVTDAGELRWTQRLIGVYQRLAGQTPKDLVGAIDEVAADGEISDADRRRLLEAGRLAVEKSETPSAGDVAGIFAQTLAEQRARVFRGIYSDAVHAGLVTGVPSTGPLEPPSSAAVSAVRDGSLARQLTTAPRERLPQVLARFERSWPRLGQYDIEGLATELTRDWDKPQASPTSPVRLLAVLYPATERYRRDNLPIAKADHRAALAAAIVSRLTDAQLARLDAPLAAGLASALMGGGGARVTTSAIEQQQAGYILPTAVNGPRTFGISAGDGKKYDAELTRLRNITASRFNWRQPPRNYYDTPDLELVEGGS